MVAPASRLPMGEAGRENNGNTRDEIATSSSADRRLRKEVEVSDVGTVIEVGDGIARVYGLAR